VFVCALGRECVGWFVNSNDVSCLSYVFVCDMCLYVLLAENVKGGLLAQVMCV